MIINRLIGKSEIGSALDTVNMLNNIKPYTSSLDYWRKVFDGKEVVTVEWLKTLLIRLCG
jgi:hypothetical protein